MHLVLSVAEAAYLRILFLPSLCLFFAAQLLRVISEAMGCSDIHRECSLAFREVISRIVLTLFLVSAVFIVQPWVAFGALVLFGGFYLIVFSGYARAPRLSLTGCTTIVLTLVRIPISFCMALSPF